MILVDTSVWIDHLRRGNGRLVEALEAGVVACHPFVIGELACGSLQNRSETLGLLRTLPVVTMATDSEVLAFVEAKYLMGRGVGYVDVHLMAAAVLHGARLWSLDRRLAQGAETLGIRS